MKSWTLRFREVDKQNFDSILDGSKPIETRAASVKYRPIQVGDELIFVCGNERFSKQITKIYHWPTIDEMVGEIPFRNIMPDVNSIEEMKKVYASYPGYKEKIEESGLLGFELK
jgi:ASC-1-like (ASCH) protein